MHMILPCTKLQEVLKNKLRLKVVQLKADQKLGKLLSIVIGENPEQESYVKIKKRIGEEIGVTVEKIVLPIDTESRSLTDYISRLSTDTSVSGIIIQQPMPKSINPQEVYESMPLGKEIEGHKEGSPYIFPLVQACILGLTWTYKYETSEDKNIDPNQFDIPMVASDELVNWLKSKSVAIAGNGITTGRQIAKYFKSLEIPYHQTNSKSRYPDGIYKKADIIVTGVGKKIITINNIKPGVTLLNFGLRKAMLGRDGVVVHRLLGDYDQDEISSKASIYTKTPGGLGPIDVLCLFGNHLKACEK